MEVEAIGHVRHKNLVRLLGYCIEGTHRYYILLSSLFVYIHFELVEEKSLTSVFIDSI